MWFGAFLSTSGPLLHSSRMLPCRVFFFFLLLLLLLILSSSNRHSQCAEPRGSEEESQVAIFTVSRTRLRRLRFYYLIKKKLSTKEKKKAWLQHITVESRAKHPSGCRGSSGDAVQLLSLNQLLESCQRSTAWTAPLSSFVVALSPRCHCVSVCRLTARQIMTSVHLFFFSFSFFVLSLRPTLGRHSS